MLVRTLAIGVGLVVAAVTSQLPEFTQQYVQRLGGAVDELRAIVERFDSDAREMGLARQEAIRRLTGNADEFVKRRGVSAERDVRRYERLAPHYRDMVNATPLGRVIEFLQADGQVVQRTVGDFQPALPLTIAGGVAAGIGFAFGLFAVFGTRRAVKKLAAASQAKTPLKPVAAEAGPSARAGPGKPAGPERP